MAKISVSILVFLFLLSGCGAGVIHQTTPKDLQAVNSSEAREQVKSDFATQDARLVSDYLIKVLGYPEENVITLLDDRALKSDFEKYFEQWLFNNVENGSTVFIYYSGHGSPNPQTGDAFLVPYDGDPTFI